jgi:excinuclease ABC subunit C
LAVILFGMQESPSSHLLSSSSWALLPRVSGVYIYKNNKSDIIYVGKAKNLKNRVRQYFQPYIKLGPKTAALVSQVNSIEYIEVFSEIEALLLETRLINKFKPKYNISSKDDKSPYYIHITKGGYPKPIVSHLANGSLAGPFLSGFIARSILNQFRRVAPYCTAKNPEKPCFYTHLGLCDPDPFRYQKNIFKLKKMLKGEFGSVSRKLKQQMHHASSNRDFEQAAVLRDRLKSLDHLLQRPVVADEYLVNPNLVEDRRLEALNEIIKNLKLKIKNLVRIEMYDISNLSGTFATGAMTVAIEGQLAPGEYRHFTIRKVSTPNDVDMMREMLTRRLANSDWPKPDLIILDGGLSQLSILKSLITNLESIPVFTLAKREEVIYSRDGGKIKLPKNNPGLQLLQRLRDEAHRFSRRLHHIHRSATINK